MSEEKFIVNEGAEAKLVSVESKEPAIVAELKKEIEKQASVPVELVAPVEKKKRGRPVKKVVKTHAKEEPAKQWYCSTCREYFDDSNVMKIGAGDNRFAVFCNVCQRSFGFQDQVMHDKVAYFVKNNPTGKK